MPNKGPINEEQLEGSRGTGTVKTRFCSLLPSLHNDSYLDMVG